MRTHGEAIERALGDDARCHRTDKRGAHHLSWEYNAGVTETGGVWVGVLLAADPPQCIAIQDPRHTVSTHGRARGRQELDLRPPA